MVRLGEDFVGWQRAGHQVGLHIEQGQGTGAQPVGRQWTGDLVEADVKDLGNSIQHPSMPSLLAAQRRQAGVHCLPISRKKNNLDGGQPCRKGARQATT